MRNRTGSWNWQGEWRKWQDVRGLTRTQLLNALPPALSLCRLRLLSTSCLYWGRSSRPDLSALCVACRDAVLCQGYVTDQSLRRRSVCPRVFFIPRLTHGPEFPGSVASISVLSEVHLMESGVSVLRVLQSKISYLYCGKRSGFNCYWLPEI